MANKNTGDWFTAKAARAVTALLLAAALVASSAGRLVRRLPGLRRGLRPAGRRRMALVGTFYNLGWFQSHIRPLVECDVLETIYVITDQPLPLLAKVQYVRPPRWLGRMLGRLWCVAWTALRRRPDYCMGYHIMPNGLLALLMAALGGGRSIYQMTGGPIQIHQGGHGSENVLLRQMGGPSPDCARLMKLVVRQFDLVIARGREAKRYILEQGFNQRCEVLTGSIDVERFRPGGGAGEWDVVCVSRLVAFKGMEGLLRAVGKMSVLQPGVRVAIVGDGPLKEELQEQARALGIERNCEFLGRREDVAELLARSRMFMLLSPNEGMSIAMLEAMAAGLPVVVTEVGDLADMVAVGESGYLVRYGDAARAAARAAEILADEGLRERLGRRGREMILEGASVRAVAKRWVDILSACL